MNPAVELTKAELGIWLGQQATRVASAFSAAQCLLLHGPLDEAAFERALDTTLREAEALHARFSERRGMPERQPLPYPGPRSSRVDLPGAEPPSERLLEHAQRVLSRPLNIDAGELYEHQLIRLDDTLHAWLFVAHHVALDGYGFNLIERRVAEHYTALTLGAALPARAFAPRGPVLEADSAYRASAAREIDRQFWLNELHGVSGVQLGQRSLEPSPSRRTTRPLTAEMVERLRSLAKGAGLAWTDLLLAGVARLVHARSGATDFALGTPVMLRLGTPAVRAPMMVMNITGLPVHCEPSLTYIELAQQLQTTQRRQKPHQRYRYEDLKSEPSLAGRRSFGPVVNLMPFDLPLRFGDCRAEVLGISAGPVEDVSFGFVPSQGGFQLTLDAHPDSFDDAQVGELADELLDGLHVWSSDPSRSLGSFLPAASVSAASPALTVVAPHAALLARARSRPTASALEWAEQRLTYAELVRAVAACARHLSDWGLQPGELVAVDLPRSAEAVLVLLAIHALGAGYAALDSKHPPLRRQQLLDELEPRLLISAAGAALPLRAPAPTRSCQLPARALELWVAAPEVNEPPAPFEPESTAYVVFTSGSTGEAKGVVISHGALAHFVTAALATYGIDERDRVLQFAPLAFDTSVEEIFVTLSAGATLILRDDAMLDSMSAFSTACEQRRITVLDLPTAFWHELSLALGQASLRIPASLRLVIIGGEAALPGRLREWQRGAPGVRLLNSYGPAETTVVVSCAELGHWQEGTAIPIGEPLPFVRALLVNEAGAVLHAAEASGELYLTGPTLAQGYFRRPDLTAQRFSTLPGIGRAYRTGDRVSRAVDGQLTFIGRVDDELKISGYRVAPAEVEAALSRHPLVQTCAILVSGKQLVAYVEADLARIDEGALRSFLLEQLPAALVPSTFELRAELPRSTNGKLDRAALRRVLPNEPESAAVSPTQQRVIAAWQDVLGLTGVALDDNFFAKGGTSLQVIQLANRLSTSGTELSVAAIFRNPTPFRQAELLDSTSAEPGPEGFVLGPAPIASDWFRGPRLGHRGARRVLLTGATGFVGVHLLQRWLAEPDTVVVCPVRALDEQDARRRVLDQARRFGIALAAVDARWQARAIDLSDSSGINALHALEPCEVIVHSAAQVSLTRDYTSLFEVNVRVTRELIRLAGAWGSEHHQLSTIATAPRGAEERFYEQHADLPDGYCQSKWHAELLCQQAGELGLPTAVYRLGRITGAAAHPSVNRSDLIWRIARSASRVGAWPELGFAEPWMPADVTADTVVRLALSGSATTPGQVYHLLQTGNVALDRVHRALQRLDRAPVLVSVPEWLDRLRAIADDEDRATLAFFELNRSRESRPGALPERDSRVRELVPGVTTTPVTDELIFAYCQQALSLGLLAQR